MKLIILLLISFKLYSQDTLYLKVLMVRTTEKQTHYWLKDIKTKDRYFTSCECRPDKKKGQIVKVLRREIEIIPLLVKKRLL